MKKSLIALAVAGAMTAPMIAQADATLYGYVETRLTDTEDSDLDLSSTKVELGVIGTADNDIEGLETGFQIEWRFDSSQADADEATSTDGTDLRKANVWLEGAYGRAQFGMQNNPAERGVWSISNRMNAALIDQTDRINNAAVYISPNMGGLELSAGLAMDGGLGDDGDDVDMTVFGASYRAMGLGLGIGYQDVKNSNFGAAAAVAPIAATSTTAEVPGIAAVPAIGDYDITSVQANYKIDALAVGASYQVFDGEGDGNDHDAWLVGAAYTLDKAQLFAEYSEVDYDEDDAASVAARQVPKGPFQADEDDSMVVVGARYKLGAKAMVQLEVAKFDERNDITTLEYQVNF